MRLTKTLFAAALIASSLSLAACHDHPGHWGDHHHGHHDDGDHGDHGGY